MAARLLVVAVVLAAVPATAQGPARPSSRAPLAEKAYALALAMYDKGLASPEEPYRWSVRWLDSVGPSASRDHLQRMQDLERKARARHADGVGTDFELTAASYYRAEAEAWIDKGAPHGSLGQPRAD